MRVSFANGFYAGLLVTFVVGIWLVKLWGAENQVDLHSAHLIAQIEKGSVSGAVDFIAANYHDDWGDDRARFLTRLQFVRRGLVSLAIAPTETSITLSGPRADWRASVRLIATGEAAPEVCSRLNSLTTPFVLSWQHESWKPWDWQLVAVSNPELQIPAGDF
ncbi:MAG TPA: hypothetical protein VGG02_00780 [Chthoniobacterales bacterium]|jgi:hypothetical protein